MFDQILAAMLFVIIINSLKRLTMGVKARYTSWGMFILIVNGFLFIRFPEALGFDLDQTYLWAERFIAYTIALNLNLYDWIIYADLKARKEEDQEDAAEQLLD